MWGHVSRREEQSSGYQSQHAVGGIRLPIWAVAVSAISRPGCLSMSLLVYAHTRLWSSPALRWIVPGFVQSTMAAGMKNWAPLCCLTEKPKSPKIGTISLSLRLQVSQGVRGLSKRKAERNYGKSGTGGSGGTPTSRQPSRSSPGHLRYEYRDRLTQQ